MLCVFLFSQMCPPRPSLGEHVHYTSLTNCNQSSLRALSLPLSLSPPSLPFLMLSPLSHALSSHLISLSLSLSLSLSCLCVSVCLSVCLSVCQSFCLSVCVSVSHTFLPFCHPTWPRDPNGSLSTSGLLPAGEGCDARSAAGPAQSLFRHIRNIRTTCHITDRVILFSFPLPVFYMTITMETVPGSDTFAIPKSCTAIHTH